MRPSITPFCVGIVATVVLVSPLAAGDFESPPISYSEATPNNCISRLQQRLDAGEITLKYDDRAGYLKSVLAALDVHSSSQMLVFSKTSFQRQKISPRTPRAIYFNDDVYVGYCLRGDVLEFTAVDPQLGAVFYALEQDPTQEVKFVRQTDSCLICHGSSMTHGVPGHVVRSVYPSASGEPIYSAGTFRTTSASPLAQRWGGWYVTGTHGDQPHMGNYIARTRTVNEPIDNHEGHNLQSLKSKFDVGAYLEPTSDIVALMIMEHQCECQNDITKATFETRQALHYEQALQQELAAAEGGRWPSTTRRIDSACEALVKHLLCCDETPLTSPITGSAAFAAEFMARGRKDSQGRSLRDLDLQRRLFKYPLSYLIDSEQFAALPDEAKTRVWALLHQRLTTENSADKHLSPEDRQAIFEIVRETHPELQW